MTTIQCSPRVFPLTAFMLLQDERDAALLDQTDAQTKQAAARRAAEADLRSAAVEAAENDAAVIAAEERWMAAGRLYPSAQVSPSKLYSQSLSADATYSARLASVQHICCQHILSFFILILSHP